jgi:hypothetical protein
MTTDPICGRSEIREFSEIGEVRITTWKDFYAPSSERWCATFGDYDLGSSVGHGTTEEAVIKDLMENYD